MMMNKRGFLRALLGVTGLGVAGLAHAKLGAWGGKREEGGRMGAGRLLLQASPLAGFQFYRGQEIWGQMQPGDMLTLVRAPWNRYDKQAVEVWRQNDMLGHLPREANTTVAQMLDRGEPLHAVIAGLQMSCDPWECVTLEVWRDPRVRLPKPQRAGRRQRVWRC